jgi:hypothetical protein
MKHTKRDNHIEKEPLFDPYEAKSIYVEENMMKPSEIAPKDTGSSYLMCLLFGIAAVLPWNVIIAAMDIFETKVILPLLSNHIIKYSSLNTSLLR